LQKIDEGGTNILWIVWQEEMTNLVILQPKGFVKRNNMIVIWLTGEGDK